jgi:hypothetical protein
MKKNVLIAAGLALALAGAAHAEVTKLGSGPGDYNFTGTHDSSYLLTLTQGDYLISSNVSADAFTFDAAWLSTSGDASPNNGNDLLSLTSTQDGHGESQSGYLLHVTDPTMKLYFNVDTHFARGTHGGSFAGELSVSAVPEPATDALMLAGLGMLGFVGARRRRQG